MSSSVTIVDYGMGNLLSVSRALEQCGADVLLSNSATGILSAERLVLPGVGAFKDGMQGLEGLGLVEAIQGYALTGRPLLGICLGMQMLMDFSEEFGHHKGLGVIPGSVVPIPSIDANGLPLKVPHIGWNTLVSSHSSSGKWEASILKGIAPEESVYFVHSFNALPQNPQNRLADSLYGGIRITAVVCSGAVYGCQYHPEKSGRTGLKILSNFLDLIRGQELPNAQLIESQFENSR